MSKQHPLWPALALMIVLALGLAACGPASTPEPEPTPTRPMRPTFTPSAVPTDTPVPTNTPVPTDTPVPVPTDTPTPAAPKAVIGGDGQVNVRSGPGTAYPETGQVATGSELELVSKNAAGDYQLIVNTSSHEYTTTKDDRPFVGDCTAPPSARVTGGSYSSCTMMTCRFRGPWMPTEGCNSISCERPMPVNAVKQPGRPRTAPAWR